MQRDKDKSSSNGSKLVVRRILSTLTWLGLALVGIVYLMSQLSLIPKPLVVPLNLIGGIIATASGILGILYSFPEKRRENIIAFFKLGLIPAIIIIVSISFVISVVFIFIRHSSPNSSTTAGGINSTSVSFSSTVMPTATVSATSTTHPTGTMTPPSSTPTTTPSPLVPTQVPSQGFTPYTIGRGGYGIAAGPNNTLWITVTNGNSGEIVEINTQGQIINSFPTKLPSSNPYSIVLGPDHAFWFTDFGTGKIGRIDYQGNITEYGGLTSNARPTGITLGSDDNLWFTQTDGNQDITDIGRITPSGGVTEFDFSKYLIKFGNTTHITAGSDGNLYITEALGNKIMRLATNGVNYQETSSIKGMESVAYPNYITEGPDGNIWFTEFGYNRIGMVNIHTLALHEYDITTNYKSGVAVFEDLISIKGNLCFIEQKGDSLDCEPINASTLAETVWQPTIYPIGDANASPQEMAIGSDNRLWITESGGSNILAFGFTN